MGGGRGRSRGRRLSGRRSVSPGGIAIWDFTFDGVSRLGHVFTVLILRVDVHIEDSKTDACFCEIPAYGRFDSKETVVGQRVRACYDGEHVDSDRQLLDYIYFRGRKGGPTQEGVCGDGGFEDDGFGVGMGEAVCPRAGEKGGGWAWHAGWRGYDHVGIHKVDAQVNVMVAGVGLPFVVDALNEASLDLPDDVL